MRTLISYLNVRAVSDDDDADVQGQEQQRHLTTIHHVDGAVVERSTYRQVALESDQHQVVCGQRHPAPVEGLSMPAVAHQDVDVVIPRQPHERLPEKRQYILCIVYFFKV